jgi:peptide/nickel transport system permease protein
VSFIVLHLSGDPAQAMLGREASGEAIAAFRKSYGLDDSIPTQYLRYLKELGSGNLGTSMQYHRPVTDLFFQRLPATLELAAFALIVAVGIGVPAGTLAALKRNSIWDRVTMLTAFAGHSAPSFFIGIMMIFTLSLRLHWFPSSGRGDVKQLVMPGLSMSVGLLAGLARMTRSSVLEAAQADYIRTARAKGLPERRVVTWHILRNASIPIVTMSGMWISGIIGGSAVIETVFAWPGVGRLIVGAVTRRDFPVVQTTILFISLSVISLNLIVDLIYGWLDPRISVVS